MNNYIVPVFIPVAIELPENIYDLTSEDVLQAVLSQTDYCSSDNFTILTMDMYPLSSTDIPIPLDVPVTAVTDNPLTD